MLIVAAIAAASYLVYAYMNGDPMFGTLAKTMDDLPRNERLGSKRNIVVLGVDGREKDDDPGRSDTLFVVMFDPKSKNVSLLSIPRDTRVRIPGHGWDKNQPCLCVRRAQADAADNGRAFGHSGQ